MMRTALFWIVCAIGTQLLAAQAPGTVDPTFVGRVHGAVEAIVIQPDGRLVVGGDLSGPNLVRLALDGAFDPTFAPTSGVPRQVTKLALQPDGKVLVGNKGGVDGGYPSIGFSRFLADGRRDESFQFRLPTYSINSGLWSGFWTTALAVQPDGKILLAGHYERDHFDYWYWSSVSVQRRPSDGSEGEFFNPPLQYVGVLALLPDQQLLVAGDQLARLNADGTHDTGFVRTIFPHPGFSPRVGIECCISQPDGRILIGGNFTNIQGQARCRIARLMPDGQLDLSFNPPVNTRDGEPYYTVVQALALQPDGRILVGGNFETMAGLAYAALARLNSDGSLDTSFPPVVRHDPEEDYVNVNAIIIQDGDRALIGGENIVTSDGIDLGDLVRIHLGTPQPRLSILQDSGGAIQLRFAYSGSHDFTVLTSTNLHLPASEWTVLGLATNIGAGVYQFTHQVAMPEEQRYYKLRSAGTPGD